MAKKFRKFIKPARGPRNIQADTPADTHPQPVILPDTLSDQAETTPYVPEKRSLQYRVHKPKRKTKKDRYHRIRKPGNPRLKKPAAVYAEPNISEERPKKHYARIQRKTRYLRKRKKGNPLYKKPVSHLSRLTITSLIDEATVALPEYDTSSLPVISLPETPVVPQSEYIPPFIPAEIPAEPEPFKPARKRRHLRPQARNALLAIAGMIVFITIIFRLFSSDAEAKIIPSAKTSQDSLGLIDLSKRLDHSGEELNDMIQEYFTSEGIDPSTVAYAIEDLYTGDRFMWNEKTDMFAASTYKLPLAMIWLDKVYNGQYKLTSKLYYSPMSYETGSTEFDLIPAGTSVTLSKTIHASLLHSDNTASHILFDHLGGWQEFRKLQKKYSKYPPCDDIFSYENYMRVNYMLDVAVEFYDHPEKYQYAISLLEDAAPDSFLNSAIPMGSVQKLGSYEEARNSVGYTPGKYPYAIVVFTSLGDYGETVMGNINVIAYRYFNGEEPPEVPSDSKKE